MPRRQVWIPPVGTRHPMAAGRALVVAVSRDTSVFKANSTLTRRFGGTGSRTRFVAGKGLAQRISAAHREQSPEYPAEPALFTASPVSSSFPVRTAWAGIKYMGGSDWSSGRHGVAWTPRRRVEHPQQETVEVQTHPTSIRPRNQSSRASMTKANTAAALMRTRVARPPVGATRS